MTAPTLPRHYADAELPDAPEPIVPTRAELAEMVWAWRSECGDPQPPCRLVIPQRHPRRHLVPLARTCAAPQCPLCSS